MKCGHYLLLQVLTLGAVLLIQLVVLHTEKLLVSAHIFFGMSAKSLWLLLTCSCVCVYFVHLISGQKAISTTIPEQFPLHQKRVFLAFPQSCNESRQLCEHVTVAYSPKQKTLHTLNMVLPPLCSPLETLGLCPASSSPGGPGAKTVSWVASPGQTFSGSLLGEFI